MSGPTPTPAEPTPRQRLLRHGAGGLTDAELLAVLLRYRSAEEVAERLLVATGGLAPLLQTGRPVLRRCGASDGRAAVVLAAAELVRRLAAANLDGRQLLDEPDVVAEYVLLRYGGVGQEVVGALYLNRKNRLIAEQELFRGTASRAPAAPGPILRAALQHQAPQLILFHTHPSGDPSPSLGDYRFTRQLVEAGQLLGVTLVDHLIVADGGRWLSLGRSGSW